MAPFLMACACQAVRIIVNRFVISTSLRLNTTKRSPAL